MSAQLDEDPITLIAVYDADSCVGRCDAGCYDAPGPECDCICGGASHGTGKQQAISNTLKHAYQWLDRAIEADPSILAANILPDAAALALMEETKPA
jgi:hypothetical protein